MTPEEIRTIYPNFIVTEMEKEDPPDFQSTRITDFLPMIINIWVISNKEFQERFWVRRELPDVIIDSFDETTETFETDAEAVLNQKDPCIVMTARQREMLSELLRLVEEYDGEDETPFRDYGRIDEQIVYGKKWDKIRQYAKQVYKEITGESADHIPESE